MYKPTWFFRLSISGVRTDPADASVQAQLNFPAPGQFDMQWLSNNKNFTSQLFLMRSGSDHCRQTAQKRCCNNCFLYICVQTCAKWSASGGFVFS
ncbi:unnamed protein product [Polarella glacialis]|uniref:Uncharacterized protein n=1 Tax=Polarella glacialis TaxID=89957 RepID=A0A813HL53_POLGL|nr:unnamed protein product [Polarella glacialis]